MAALLMLLAPAILADLDLRLYDSLPRPSVTATEPARTLIVAIDERSLSELGRWPWPRRVTGDLVDRLRSMGASIVALDVLLAEAEPGASTAPDGSADVALAEALARAPAVTAYAFTFGGEGADLACAPRQFPLVQRTSPGSPEIQGLSQASGAVCSIALFDRAVGASGFINAATDADGRVRRTPVLVAYRQHVYPSLALAAVLRAGGETTIRLEPRSDGSPVLHVGQRQVPLDPRGQVLLRYRGPGGTIPRVSAADVIADRVPADAVRGRVVLIGPTAIGLGDVVSTPVDSAFPGVEVHATVVEGLLSGRVNARPVFAQLIELGLAGLAGLAVVWAARRLGHLWAALAAGALGAGAWLAAGVLLGRTGLYLSPLFTMVAAVGAVGFETGRSVLWERRRTHTAQRFVVHVLTSLTETKNVETGRHVRRTEAYARLLAT